jgi:hypothetical protein
MKRFYCTICEKVKRVRKYPRNVALSTRASIHPEERVGTCNRHADESMLRVARKAGGR